MGFFDQLKQRRIFQIVASYAAAGWVVVSVIDQFVDREIVPAAAYNVTLAWYLAGLLIALVVGWYHGERGRQRVSRDEMALLGLCVLVGVGLTVLLRTPSAAAAGREVGVLEAGTPGLDPHRLAVLYLDDVSPDRSLEHVADGLTETLIDELAAVPALNVVSKNGALQFKLLELPRDSVARSVGAGTIVTGSVENAPAGRIRVNVALSDGASGTEFRRGSFERAGDDLLALQADLGAEVARMLREWLGEEIALRMDAAETRNVAAWAQVQRGEQARKDFELRLVQDDLDGALARWQRADSFFVAASELEPRWSRPQVQRAELAVRMAQLTAGDLDEAAEWIERGLADAERALALDAANGRAFEHRGTLRYLRWRLGLEPEPTAAEALLASAEQDLTRATTLDSNLANAWNLLSIIRSQQNDIVGAKVNALRAYEEDAFLRSAQDVLWRLYATSYDLEQFDDAVESCDEGRRRFPAAAEFVECRLWLLAAGAVPADAPRAWALADTLVALSPPHLRDWNRVIGQITVAGTLARAQLPDSADAVLVASRAGPDVDPTRELLAFEAVVRVQMGQRAEAVDLLRSYLEASPEHREGWRWTNHWWWKDLQDDPGFQRLLTAS